MRQEKWYKDSKEHRLYQYENTPQCIFCDRPTYMATYYYPKGSKLYHSYIVCPYCQETNANCGGSTTLQQSQKGALKHLGKRRVELISRF